MDKKIYAKLKALIAKRQTIVTASAMLAVAAVLLFAIQFNSTERSVAAYCAVYREENAKLAHAQGDAYGVGVFSHKSSDPKDFAKAFSELERVAPDDIQPNVKALQDVFEEIDSEPSQALGSSLSGVSAESSVKAWTVKHCDRTQE